MGAPLVSPLEPASALDEHRVDPAAEFAQYEIDPAPIWPADDSRLEPIVLASPLWYGYDTAAGPPPPEPELAVPTAGDARRPICEEEQPEPLSPLDQDARVAAARPPSSSSLLGSLGVHALPLLLLLGWSAAPTDIEAAIPVRLVIEESIPAPDPPSDPPLDAAANDQAERPQPVLVPPPRRQQTAAALPPTPMPTPTPKREPKPEAKPALKPAEARTRQPVAEPRPRERATPAPVAAVLQGLPAPLRPPTPSQVGAARASYFERLVALTRPHLHMLPASFLAGRRGRTVLSIVVHEDGAVERITVKQSSGYPDIDSRIQQMVGAIGRFPPLPENFQRPSVELDFNLAFPDAMQQ